MRFGFPTGLHACEGRKADMMHYREYQRGNKRRRSKALCRRPADPRATSGREGPRQSLSFQDASFSNTTTSFALNVGALGGVPPTQASRAGIPRAEQEFLPKGFALARPATARAERSCLFAPC